MSDFDGRIMTVKGWSVTLSLAALGLGFQNAHFAFFGLSALSAASFWAIEALMKGQQIRYYGRMREIEIDSYRLNRVELEGDIASAPRADWAWDNFGSKVSKSKRPVGPEPERRDVERSRKDKRRVLWWPHVFLPHLVSVVAGLGLLILSVLGMIKLPV